MTRQQERLLRNNILIFIAIILLAEVIRRIALSHSLYAFNLRATTPLAHLPPQGSGQKVLIFAPHEDDETLGNAGYIQQAVKAGNQVSVVMMTNGEYPEIDVLLFEESLPIKPEAFIKLGYRRQQETLSAMRILGVPQDHVTFLGYPNQYLNQMWSPMHWLPANPVQSRRTRATRSPYNNSMTPGAVYCGQSMLNDVKTVLQREQPDIVITIHPNDIHVDHWPTYAVVGFALNELAQEGAPFARRAQMYTYLIHRPAWPVPRKDLPYAHLDPPQPLVDLKQTYWMALPLTMSETMIKRSALRQYHTQGGAIDPLLLSFIRSNELYGGVTEYTWPDSPDVPSHVIIRDQVGDSIPVINHPQADIASVTLTREGGQMHAAIYRRKPGATGTKFHLSMHAGGASPSDRLVVQYDWTLGQAEGVIVRGKQLAKLDKQHLAVQNDGKASIITAPWPLTDGRQRFFMVRAWTSDADDRRLIDQTATETFAIGGH